MKHKLLSVGGRAVVVWPLTGALIHVHFPRSPLGLIDTSALPTVTPLRIPRMSIHLPFYLEC